MGEEVQVYEDEDDPLHSGTEFGDAELGIPKPVLDVRTRACVCVYTRLCVRVYTCVHGVGKAAGSHTPIPPLDT